jgi:excinuclease ABC subunit C
MKKDELKIKNLPDKPGVYFFLGSRKKILYIGKATSLRNRVQSYFSNDIDEKRSLIIKKMVEEAKTVECTQTDSVLEALILEANLIRTHKPAYNTKSKDNKSYNHLIITNEKYPRVLIVRGKDLTENFSENEIKYTFGPYPNSQLFREALKIIRKIFKFYDTKTPISDKNSKMEKGKIIFNIQIGLYPNILSEKEYNKTIKHLRLFLEGKKHQLISVLEKEMYLFAKKEEFEKANYVKKQIFALNHIEDIALVKDESRIYRDEKRIRIEAYDIAHFQGDNMVGGMVVVEGGEPAKSEYRKFKIKNFEKANDTGALKEVLTRRFNHKEWLLPQIIVVDGGVAQKNVAEFIVKKYALVIPVVAVVKDDHHRPNRLIGQKNLIEKHKNSILLANNESHRFTILYHRQKRSVLAK